MPTQAFNYVSLATPRLHPFSSSQSTQAYASNAVSVASIFNSEYPNNRSTTIDGGFVNFSAVSSPSAKLSLQGVSGSVVAKPDGSIKDAGGGSAPVSKTFTPTTGIQTVTFDNFYTPTAGEMLSLVLELVSGTFTQVIGCSLGANCTPFVSLTTNSGTNWTAQTTLCPHATPFYHDGSIPDGFNPFSSLSALTPSSTNVYGVIFTPSMDCVLTGADVLMRPASSTSWCIKLYEGSSTTVSSTTLRSTSGTITEKGWVSTGASSIGYIGMPEYTLTAGTVYRLVLVMVSGNPASFIQSLYNSQAKMAGVWGPLAGTFGNGTTWTDYASSTDWRGHDVIPVIKTMTYTASPPATSWVKA